VSLPLINSARVVDFLTSPRFLFRPRPKLQTEEVIRQLHEHKTNSSNQELRTQIHKLALERLETLLENFESELGLKTRIAFEFEFSLRDSKNQPVSFSSEEKKIIVNSLRESFDSFKEIKFHRTHKMIEALFDSAHGDTKNPIDVIRDIEAFKLKLPRLIMDKLGKEVVINDNPYQEDLGFLTNQFSNSSKLHLNYSFEDESGENFFYRNPNLFFDIKSSLLENQRASLAYHINQDSFKRFQQASASVNQISAGVNMETGGTSKNIKLLSAVGMSTFAAEFSRISLATDIANPNNISVYFLAAIFLNLLNTSRKAVKGNSSISYRVMPKYVAYLPEKLKMKIPQFLKRIPISKSETRIEDRIYSGATDPALAVLTSLASLRNSLKAHNEKVVGILPLPKTFEEAIAFAIEEEKFLEEIYGKELLSLLKANFVKNFLT
jgi:hypothetical protein